MLVDDGGGNSDPYQITVNPVSGGEEQSMSYQQIMPLLHGLNPSDMTAAAASFRKLGDTLNTVAAKLASTGDQLGGEQWSGAAASKAMAKFQTLHDQAARLAAQAHTTANVMDWMGNEVMPQFKSIPTPQVMGGGEQTATDMAIGTAIMPGVGTAAGAMASMFGGNGQAKADQAARQYLASFNNAMAKANSQLPPSTAGPAARSDVGGGGPGSAPAGGDQSSGSGPGNGLNYSGPGGYNGPATGVTSPFAAPAAGSGHINAAKLASGGAGTVTSPHGYTPPATGSLQGYTAPSGTSGGSPFATGAPGPVGSGGGSPFSQMTMVPGGGLGSGEGAAGEALPGEGALGKSGLPGEGGVPGEAVPGESGVAGGAAGPGEAAGAAGGAGAEGTGAAVGDAAGAEAAGVGEAGGMGAMPMGGMGGGGQQDKERQRQAWMAEDESIWGVPDTDVGPIIG